MFHLAEGTLRRYRDDPLILTTSQRQHFDRCPVCQRRHAAIARDAEGIENFFTMPPAPVNASAALARFQQHVRAEQVQPKSSRWARPGFRLQTKPLAGLAGAAVLVSGLALTPAGSMAQSLLTIFQPKQITTVTFTTGDLRSLPNLRAFGTLQMPRNIGDEQASTSSRA